MTVVPEENVISAMRSLSRSKEPTKSLAAATTWEKDPDNDRDRSMTKDMSTSRRVACALARTVRLSKLARRMKVVGRVASDATSMTWEASGPIVMFRMGLLGVTPRKPGGKFTSKM